jgi:uroporphyrinogen decarboxylase
MYRDMKKWLATIKSDTQKKAFPILSFPVAQLMGINVRELIADSNKQAQGMKIIADRNDAYGANSLMDLSVEAECFGAEIIYSDNEIPTVKGSLIKTLADAQALKIPEIGTGRTGVYVDAIKKAATDILDRPVFGCLIGPFSLTGRLIGVTEAMIMCYEEPETVRLLLEKSVKFIIQYALAFKAAGANGIALAEPLAGMLSPALSEEFSCGYVRQIIDAVQDDNFIVIYHNCGNSTIYMIDNILKIGAAAYHFGNAINMSEMLSHIPDDIVVMGNVDPAGQLRDGSPESAKKATLDILNTCGQHNNFIISTGCDIPLGAKWENIDAFFETVREYYTNVSLRL